MVILKATDKLSLAAVAATKEGMLLFALRSVVRAFSEGLEKMSSGLAAEAVEVELEVVPVEVLDLDTGRAVKVVPADAVPYLPGELRPTTVRLNEKVLSLLRAVDGVSAKTGPFRGVFLMSLGCTVLKA